MLFKLCCPVFESLYTFRAKFLKAMNGLLESFLTVEVCLAEEFVSITDYLFLYSLRKEILMWQGQLPFFYLLFGDAGASMSFTHTSMALVAFCS